MTRKQRNSALEQAGETKPEFKWSTISVDSLILLAGLVGVLLGGKLLVDGAVELAKVYNIDEGIVGLTVVALGTSLPELATSIIAALKRETDLAVGNILGSNIYNIFGIGGITATISPIPITSHFASVDIPLLFVMSILLMGIVIWQHGVTRITGGVFLVGYLTYVLSLLCVETYLELAKKDRQMSDLEIYQFNCRSDNFGVLIHDPEIGITASIDAPDEQAINDALAHKGWTLKPCFIDPSTILIMWMQM